MDAMVVGGRGGKKSLFAPGGWMGCRRRRRSRRRTRIGCIDSAWFLGGRSRGIDRIRTGDWDEG